MMNPGVNSNDTTILDVVHVLRRHKKKMLFVFCSTVAIVLVGVLLMQKRYSSEAVLLLRVGRETATLDPTATLGEVVNISRTDQSEVSSILQVLKSRDLVEKVAMEIGPDVILSTDSSAGIQAVRDWISSQIVLLKERIKQIPGISEEAVSIDPEVALRYEAVDALLENVTISAPLESTVISISTEAASPGLSQSIVAAWKEQFLTEHLRLTSTEGSHKFFVEQRELIRAQLQSAQDTLRKEKDESELATVEGERTLLESLKAEVNVELFRNAREMSASEARCVDARRVVAALPKTILATRIEGIADEAQDGMRQQLYDLEIAERKMKEQYDVSHPLYKAAQRQLQEVRSILNKQGESVEHATYTMNPARETLQVELLQEEVRLASLRANAKSLAGQRLEIVQSLKNLNDDEIRIREMERQTELLDASYRLYAEKSEQSRVNDAMASNRITSINVVQNASYQPKPVGPSRAAILGAGILLAMIAAVGTALLAERFDSSLRSSRDIEEVLELPVLISIPKSSQASSQLA